MSRLTAIKQCIVEAGNRPDSVRFYLFGSVIDGSMGSDIDLLCVYDADSLPPDQAYAKLMPLFKNLSGRFGLPVHPVLLTNTEETQVRFIDSEGCISVVE
jgi:predicted nucleotidyltransferase